MGEGKLAAEARTTLEKFHLVTKQFRHSGGLHACRSAADDHDPSANRAMMCQACLEFAPHLWVHEAADHPDSLVKDPVDAALVAGDAGPDLAVAPSKRFAHEHGVGKQRAAERDEVRVAFLQQPLGQLWGLDPTHGVDREADA